MSNSIKDIYRDIDLYGSAVLIKALKSKFDRASYARKTIPGPGSPTVNSLRIREDSEIKKLVLHKNGEISAFMKTKDSGDSIVFRFF